MERDVGVFMVASLRISADHIQLMITIIENRTLSILREHDIVEFVGVGIQLEQISIKHSD